LFVSIVIPASGSAYIERSHYTILQWYKTYANKYGYQNLIATIP